jgi:tetratricopeptide (TPR) repeat protein
MSAFGFDRFSAIDDLFARRAWADAAKALDVMLSKEPNLVDALLRRSTVHLRQGEYRAAKLCALKAYQSAAQASPPALLAIARQLMALLENDALIDVLRIPRFRVEAPALALVEAGTLLSGAGAQAEALELLDLAVSREPRHAPSHYFRGNLQMFLGRIEEAEREFEQTLALEPRFAQASWALAGLRRNTPERNHVARIQQQLAAMRPGLPGETFLCYALFSELHDLGRHDEAWQALERGCRSKRPQVGYDHASELQLLTRVAEVCSSSFVQSAATVDDSATVPIFIVGMFRSGTTLLERILGGHSQVSDGGESYAFSAQLKWATDHNFPGALDAEALRRSGDIDPADLAQRYLASLRTRARGRPFLTEKLPSNFLNIGLIAKALPQARFLHMVRDPVDTCFSNLRTLFTHACGYSYDQIEMAEYFLGYRSLMAHWHRVLPGRVLDVDYARLVADPETVAREVFDHCGLAFEHETLDIDRNASSVATASTAQVRGGIRRDHKAAWKPYERQLQPLIARLAAAE